MPNDENARDPDQRTAIARLKADQLTHFERRTV
jgi:hypothetical protein